MDGQIDGAINKRVPSGEVPDSGVAHSSLPNRTTKQELSSKERVEICNEVTPELSRSSPSMTLPYKARTVSSTGSSLRKTPYSFDFRFVASDDEVRQLLMARSGDEHRDVTLISHPDDLSQGNLVSRLSISDDGRHTLRSGKLFENSQPLTLVMDIRKLTSDDLPKFNDLLDPDNPCLDDKISRIKRSLGEHVDLLVVADPAQLASVGQRDDAPGADFWRRINRPENTWQFDPQNDNDSTMEIEGVPPVLTELRSAESVTGSVTGSAIESAMDDDNTVVIDCHLHTGWRRLLLGGPGVDKQGRIQHIPGKLESLRAGQRVILKGANWQDLAFEQAIRQMLAQKSFESNGLLCQLPDDVQFYQMPVGNGELHSLFQSISHSGEKELEKKLDKGPSLNASGNPIIVNQSNIAEWLSPIAIATEGYAVPNTCLLEQVRAGGVVTVTSPLTEACWFRLLGSLQTIRETTDLQPRLEVAHSKQQPKALGLAENDKRLLTNTSNHVGFNTVTYRHQAQASHWINHDQQAPLVIQVNEQTSLSQLFDNIHISSEQKAHFGRRQSKLQEALTSGRPVVFRGLESSSTLQQLLEPLVIGQPLLVNGQLQAYPKARVTVLWPESAKSSSSVFSSMIATGKSCPEVDIWDINKVRHDIPRADLPEQALKKLYEAFKSVPGELCNPLPELTEGLLNNLILAARQAQQVDQSSQLLPRHWRKAINSVITHGTRQNPSVRDFMKVACWWLLPDAHKKPDEDQTTSVDPDRLSAIINTTPRFDREFVKQNLWPLARVFDPSVLKDTELQLSYENPFPPWRNEKEALDQLCTMIVAHAPEQQRNAMAFQLEVDPAAAKPYQSLTIRPEIQIKRLQDALASGWQLALSPGQTRSDAIQSLATDCFHIARGEYASENSDAERIERIENRLSESLVWQGSADQPLSALAQDLYHGSLNQKDRESRRLSRLHDRLADSPVLFLQGETGTGKSYFSARMARASGQVSVMSLGPSDSEQTLMKRWQWQEHADGDRSMEQQNLALMAWASTQSDKSGDYITLVLDEANLARVGLLASLNGLWEPQPCIYVNGHPVRVSSKHRVILTGNPDHYAGRQLDPALKEKMTKAYYPRLDRAFLRDRVVEPALVRHLQRHFPDRQIDTHTLTQRTAESVMTLWQYYQELLPDHEFTPRDLTDICSWVGWYLDRALPVNDSVTHQQMNGLIQQSFRDVLGPEVSESYQDALTALEIWFAARYEPDNTLSNKVHNQTTLHPLQQAFKKFTEQTRPDFDTSGSAVNELVQRLGQDLNRCQQAYNLNIKHDGRQATLIQGPAGRGKDATLNLVIESVKRQAEQQDEYMPKVFSLNACDCSWDRVCKAIQTAKVHGGIVVISEMNLIDSQHLEGELNDILAGDAHPGFHLFATINPPEYSGRKPLSPALKGRFRHLPIRQYSQEELQTIAGKVLPQTPEGKIIAEQLANKHCRLRAYLQRKKLPLQPTSLDLQNVARAVIQRGDFSEDGLHRCLNQHYRLYLMAADLRLEELPEPSTLVMGYGELDPGLCRWFNRTLPDIDRPWLIRRSDLNSLDEKDHEIRIETRLSKEEARTEIIRMVAQARWQASGLSPEPDESDDILTQTLYQHCQHRWFDHEFGQTGVDVNRVFPLTEEQKQTLKMSANQPYLQEADRRISAWNSHDVQWSPELWHQMSDLLNHLVDDFVNEASAVGSDNAPEPLTVVDAKAHEQYVSQPTDRALTAADVKAHEQYVPQPTDKALTAADVKAPEKYIPEACGIQAPALDQMTDYEAHGKSKVYDYKIFDMQNHSSGIYRKRVRDVHVTAEGEVKQIDINDRHMQGVEVLIPALLPGENQEVTLTEDQTLGTLNDTSFNGRYSLPSLTPDDYIVGLRIKPDVPFTLVRDRYSGLHTLCFHETKPLYIEQLTYVVEHRKPGKKTPAPAKGAKPEPSTRFDAHCSEGMKTVLKEVLTAIGEQPTKAQEGLRAIKNAQNATQRIGAIADYCMAFSGEAEPEAKENFFRFLVTQQQGSCRHRVPVFVAFCRYFEIPCRQIGNGVHTFAEYSLDGGLTWKSMHLGGAPVESTDIKPEFQPIRRVSDSGIMPKEVRDLLKGADSEQRKILAKACGMNLEQLNKAIETGSALMPTHLNISEIVQSLWKEENLASFSMGVSLLESLDTKVLGPEEKSLVCDVTCEDELIYSYEVMPEAMREKLFNDKLGTNEDELICDVFREVQRTYTYRPMQEAIREILSNDNEDRVIEPLKSLHSKIIVQAGANPQHWLSSMVDILKFSDLTRPSVMQLAREALKSGWLNPPTTYEDKMLKAAHHALLVGLEDIDELKAQAAHCLKSWYRNLLSREKNSQAWRSAYKNFQKEEDNAFFITHCHDGVSHSLESQILNVSLQTVWTDEPEGIPDIERMLAHDPAFVQLNSGRSNQRPVIITGQPFWRRTALNEKVAALLQRQAESNPDLKLILEKVNKYEEMNKELRNVLKALNKLKRELDDLRLMRPGETDDNQSTLLYDQYQAKEQEYEKKRLDIKSDLETLRVPHKEKKLVNNLTTKYKQAIQQAFSHYLYGVTHSKGGCLTYCWADASIAVVGAWDSISHGAHDPSSPEELHAMMSAIDNSCWLQEAGKDAYLRQAHSASNALILKPDELTNIAEEFLNSVNLDSIYESFHN